MKDLSEIAAQIFFVNNGEIDLLTGAIATLLAYLWMSRIAKLPKAQRLFTMQITTK
jgi:hypothetical protein